MKTLCVRRFGDKVQGVKLHGDPKRQLEPVHFRTSFPGGDVDVVRTDSGEYWVHIHVAGEVDVLTGEAEHQGSLVDARLDARTPANTLQPLKHVGDFAHPDLAHVAIRIGRRGG